MRKVVTLAAVATLLGATGLAQAGSICVATEASGFTGVSGCERGSTNNDFLNPLQVSLDSMFGFTDWNLDAKDDDLNGVNSGPNSIGLTLSGGVTSGTWSIAADSFSLFSDIMIVFKGANPDTYVGYLLSAVSGNFQSAFLNPNNGNLKNISHVSLYVRGNGTTTTVSEPGILVMLGLGSLMLGIARRRKS